MGDHYRFGTTRGLLAVIVAACAACGVGGCAAREYAGIPLTPGSAPVDLQALAMRARLGDKQAQFDLGERYENGAGVARDDTRARDLYQSAAQESGGTRMVYVPGTRGRRGTTIPFYLGPKTAGLERARQHLAALAARRPR